MKQLPIKRKLGYRLFIRSIAEGHAEEIEKLFPVQSDENISDALNKLTTAMAFVAPARSIARALAKRNTPVYVYQFTQVHSSPLLKPYGAFHSLEIAYVFGNFKGALVADAADKKLSETMRNYWVQFAKNGDPNVPGQSNWSSYSAKSDVYLELGNSVSVKSGLYREACDIFDKLLKEN